MSKMIIERTDEQINKTRATIEQYVENAEMSAQKGIEPEHQVQFIYGLGDKLTATRVARTAIEVRVRSLREQLTKCGDMIRIFDSLTARIELCQKRFLTGNLGGDTDAQTDSSNP